MRLRVRTTIAIACALIASLAAAAQQRHPVSGRRIADVMGHQGAAWLERTEREAEEAPSKAIAALNIRPGQVIADIGAGSGYYSVRLARVVDGWEAPAQARGGVEFFMERLVRSDRESLAGMQ